MIMIESKDVCCGCAACAQSCVKQCVNMTLDDEGFLYPEFNKELCINCRKCEQVCPVINVAIPNDSILGCYVGYTNNRDERLKSSSGGLFGLFAEYVLLNNGVVYGAAFDTDFLVHHIRVDSVNSLPKLQGSKYLQSRIENTFIEVKKDLDNNLIVLYSGTACQIAGLKLFLKKDYSNLLTIDILCHGVTSPSVWNAYISYLSQKYDGKIKHVSFRNKEFGWKNFVTNIGFDNGKEYIKSHNTDLFMRLFLSNTILRPSCYNCRFKNLNRPSDITLGDAWGISKVLPEMDNDMGTSIILLHTESGKKYLDSIDDKITKTTIDIDRILPATADSRKSVNVNSKRDQFFRMLNKNSFVCLTQWDLYYRLKRAKGIIASKLFTKDNRK